MPRRNVIRIACVTALLVLLSACGQGSKFSHPSQSAPQGVPAPQAILNDQNYAELRWDAMPGAMKYRVYSSVEDGLPAGNTQHADINDTHFIFTDANANYAAVAALWGDNEGKRSNVVILPKATGGGPGGGNPGTTPKVSFASATATVNEDGGTVSLAINLDKASATASSVSFNTRDNTAVGLQYARADTDYVTANGSVSIPAGQTTGTITVSIKNNAIYQGDRIFYVDLVHGSGTTAADLGQIQTVTVTIKEDETAPILSVTSPTLREDLGPANVEVSLSVACAFDVSFNFATRNGTATSGADYTGKNGQGLIRAGATSYTTSVEITNDSTPEPTENFFLDISNIVGVTVAGNKLTSTVTIQDDDAVQAISDLTLKNGDTQVTLSWTAAAGATSYNVYYANAKGVNPACSACVKVPSVAYIANGQTNTAQLTGLSNGQNYYFVVTAVANGVESSGSNQVAASPHLWGARFIQNDTGMVRCSNSTSSLVGCPASGYPNQDGDLGRDKTVSGGGFSYTKIDANGNNAAVNATNWDCVRDNVTGLWWENKTNDGQLRDARWTYSWYNSDINTNGLNSGTPNAGTCVDTANCDTEKYVSQVNGSKLCGFSDWRIPTQLELSSLVHLDLCTASNNPASPAVDLVFFKYLSGGFHWTAETYPNLSSWSYFVSLSSCGIGSSNPKSNYFSVVLVRSGG